MSISSSLRDRAEAFSRQHRSGEMVVLPNAWDPGSAALMAAAGFPIIATTSAGIAYARGCRDGERLGRAGMMDCVAAIDGPLNVLGAFAGRPSMTLDELRRLGVRRVSIGGSLMLSVLTQVRQTLAGIRERGDFSYAVTAITNREMDAVMAT